MGVFVSGISVGEGVGVGFFPETEKLHARLIPNRITMGIIMVAVSRFISKSLSLKNSHFCDYVRVWRNIFWVVENAKGGNA